MKGDKQRLGVLMLNESFENEAPRLPPIFSLDQNSADGPPGPPPHIAHVTTANDLKDIDTLILIGSDVDVMSSEALKRGLLGPLKAFGWADGTLRAGTPAASQFIERHRINCTNDLGAPPKSVLQFEALVRSNPRALASPADMGIQRGIADSCKMEETWCRSMYYPAERAPAPARYQGEHFVIKSSHLATESIPLSVMQVLNLYTDPACAKRVYDTSDLLEVKGGESGDVPSFLKEIGLQQLLDRCYGEERGAAKKGGSKKMKAAIDWMAAEKFPLLQHHHARASCFASDSRDGSRFGLVGQSSSGLGAETLDMMKTTAVVVVHAGNFVLKSYVSGGDAATSATMCIAVTSTWLQRIQSFQQEGGAWHPSFAGCMDRLFEELRQGNKQACTFWVRQKEEVPTTTAGTLGIAELIDKFAVKVECANCGKRGDAGDGSKKRQQLCSRCKGVRYCSQECQKQHWAVHKLQCQPKQSG